LSSHNAYNKQINHSSPFSSKHNQQCFRLKTGNDGRDELLRNYLVSGIASFLECLIPVAVPSSQLPQNAVGFSRKELDSEGRRNRQRRSDPKGQERRELDETPQRSENLPTREPEAAG
jgi:hypothetical protein